MSLLAKISRVCEQHSIPPSRFGREAVGDPRLVGDLRAGRELRPRTIERINSYIASLNG